jgi:hypothetical protein
MTKKETPDPPLTHDEIIEQATVLADQFFEMAEKLPHWGIVLRRIRLAGLREDFDEWLEALERSDG